jgi:hypothetical protein
MKCRHKRRHVRAPTTGLYKPTVVSAYLPLKIWRKKEEKKNTFGYL